MKEKEIQVVMKLVRPAVYAVFGRQPLQLSAYNRMSDNILWIEVENTFSWEEQPHHYKLRLESGIVTFLAEGRLRV